MKKKQAEKVQYRYSGKQTTLCLPNEEYRLLKLVSSALGLPHSRLVRQALLHYYGVLKEKGLLPEEMNLGNLSELVTPLVEKRYRVEEMLLHSKEELAKQKYLEARLSGFVKYFEAEDNKELADLLRIFIKTRKRVVGLQLVKEVGNLILHTQNLATFSKGWEEKRAMYYELFQRLCELLGLDPEQVLEELGEGGERWGASLV